MTHVTEHHSEQERERHDIKQRRVDFFVTRDSVSVNDFLERSNKLVCPEESWWSKIMFFHVLDIKLWELDSVLMKVKIKV